MKMKQNALLGVAILGAVVTLGAEGPKQGKTEEILDPLTCRWTFGNHEPVSMYRRAGNKVTGGIEGSALWLEDWHHWFDSEACPKLMQELGLNMCHCRFYKGMGWNFESRDFPNVKRFVENAHRHGVRVLAYVQFSTLYYETMLDEVPDLSDWAAVDENGKKRTYGNAYYRWRPCVNAPGFEPYLKKVIAIALAEGGFDGIMFDNADAPACYCSRCAALFREYLAKEPDPERRFGLCTVKHVLPPPARKPEYGELQDPIAQQWLRFRGERLTALYRRLYLHAKSCKPSAIVSANVANIRRANMAGSTALNPPDLADCFDLFVSQSGNAPGVDNGCIVNRVREMKLAQALQVPILALCDEDAGLSEAAEAQYFLPLMEDLLFGGIPTDRTVMKPDRERVSPRLVAFRQPLLQRFNTVVLENRGALAAPTFAPLRVLYSRESVMFSEQSFRALLSAEEILLRNHVPYGLLPSSADRPAAVPADCEVLLVCDQRCLSDAEITALVDYARRGGKVVVTGASGAFDPAYRQRFDNPLVKGLAGCRGTVCRESVDAAPVKTAGWTIALAAPADGGRRLLADIDKLVQPAFHIQAPPTVFAEVKRDGQAFYLHLLNYAKEPVEAGVRIVCPSAPRTSNGVTFSAPLENRAPAAVVAETSGAEGSVFVLPAFSEYGLIRLNTVVPAK